MKLNLGCGAWPKQGYVNVDLCAEGADVLHDLNVVPYPFADDSFEIIDADHVLEHIEDPFMVMREIRRIGKAGCRVSLRVPHFSRGFNHPEHLQGFDVSFPLYFDPTFKGGYRGPEFVLRRVKLHWFAQPYLKKTVLAPWWYYMGRAGGFLIDLCANISPLLCSRLWCFWVGGFEEIEFVFSVVKGAHLRHIAIKRSELWSKRRYNER